MVAAARMAKTQIDAEVATRPPAAGSDRRARIEGQSGGARGGRAGGADAELDAPNEIGEVSRKIIGNLSRFGVTEAKFKEFQGTPFERRNGRG